MNKPSSTITAAGLSGALVAIGFIVLAMVKPDAYAALPPGASETLVIAIGTVVGYFKKETVLK
jgi:hypothetical protein